MDLSTLNFPKVTNLDMAFGPEVNPQLESALLEEAKKRDQKREIEKGKAKFKELFYSGGEIQLRGDVKGTWKEDAWLWCRAFMGSFNPKHEHKELICAMLIEECLVLKNTKTWVERFKDQLKNI